MSLSFKDMEEFVLDFMEEGSITPIDIVMDVTGLTYDEVKSCCEILVID
jgi:spore coat protein CotH